MTPTAVRARTALSVLGAVALAAVAHVRASGAPASPAPVRYTLGLLVRGPAWTAERTPRTDSIQAGHRANIRRMWEHGALLAAGPFEDGGDLRGVFVFRPGDDTRRSRAGGSWSGACRGSGPPASGTTTGDAPPNARRRGSRRRTPW